MVGNSIQREGWEMVIFVFHVFSVRLHSVGVLGRRNMGG